MVMLILVVMSPAAAQKRADIVFEDFEGQDYGRWTTTGTAFGSGPAHGAVAGSDGGLGVSWAWAGELV